MNFEKSRFEGIVVPIVNPCNEDDSLNFNLLNFNLTRLLSANIAGLYINGGTGDATNLSQQERIATAELLIPPLLAAGKSAIVHVGQTNQRQSISLAEHAMKSGAHAVASVPPQKPWQLIVQYYQALAATGAPIIVYYIPGLTGQTAGMSELRQLMDIPSVVGIKMSDWNVFLLRSLKLAYPEKVVYSGFDEMLLPGLLYGADGCIGTWMNLFPDLYVKVYEFVRSGKTEAARPLNDEFTAFLAYGWKFGILNAFEELMQIKGYAQRCFRRPSSWHPGWMPADLRDELVIRMHSLESMTNQL